MDDAITEFVVEELGNHRARNELVAAVARRANLSWYMAEQLIQQVEAEHQGRIVRRRSPLLIAVGVVTAITGATMMAIGGTTIYGSRVYLLKLFESVKNLNLGELAEVLPYLPYAPDTIYRAFILLVTGLAMFVGAAWGLGPVILELWEHWRSE